MGNVRFALRFPHTFYVLAILIVFLGTTAIIATPKDIFPEINIPVVTVIWQYTGLSPKEMEVRVATYSEYSLSSSVTGIKNIESQTLEGISRLCSKAWRRSKLAINNAMRLRAKMRRSMLQKRIFSLRRRRSPVLPASNPTSVSPLPSRASSP